ncbi:MAG: YvcK family protein [Firmicutes bacterium]|nr:YvcK family protein [Bacillota bacterium]
MWRLLAPGLKLKRFLALIAVGFMALGVAIGLSVWTDPHLPYWRRPVLETILLVSGVALVILGFFGLWRSINEVLGSDRWAGLLYSRRQLARGPHVAALGGGTGMPSVLRGLKHFTSNLTAIVTVADDGGSSGRLRGELGMLPPGDIRNCMVALADTEPLMEQLFQHRFQSGELKGHSFGNLFLAAMEQASGDFVTALRESSRVLAVRGTVLPATLEHVTLHATLASGAHVEGESAIGQSPERIERIWMDPSDATPLREAVAAILAADMVVLGPGSLYTSILPNLLIPAIQDAIRQTKGIRVYVANIMTQPGETANFSVRDHLQAIEDHVGSGLIDVVLVNREPVPKPLLEKYWREGAEQVAFQGEELWHGSQPVVIYDNLLLADGVVRHDPDKLAPGLLRILINFRPKWAEGRLIDALWLENRLRERHQPKWDGHMPDRLKRN